MLDESDLQTAAADLGIALSETQAWELLFHLDAVLRTNETLNLTAITDRDEGVRLHVLDSLACLPVVARAPEGPLVDLGSGAGYPGIPLSIATDRDVTLVDSTRKKATFLALVAKALDHEIDVFPGRAEELASSTERRFAVVTARAVAPIASLVELAAPLLEPGGHMIALKGSPDTDELEQGNRAAEVVGLTAIDDVEIRLPSGGEARRILVFERTGDSTVELPRRVGMAQKRPLG